MIWVKNLENLTHGNYFSLWQEWTNDRLENEMDIVLDAVNRIRSMKPPTDSNERYVHGHLFCFCVWYLLVWFFFNLLLQNGVISCWYFLLSLQATCFCTLPRPRDCCYYPMLSISHRVSFLCVTSQGYALHFCTILLFFIREIYALHHLQSIILKPKWSSIAWNCCCYLLFLAK